MILGLGAPHLVALEKRPCDHIFHNDFLDIKIVIINPKSRERKAVIKIENADPFLGLHGPRLLSNS